MRDDNKKPDVAQRRGAVSTKRMLLMILFASLVSIAGLAALNYFIGGPSDSVPAVPSHISLASPTPAASSAGSVSSPRP